MTVIDMFIINCTKNNIRTFQIIEILVDTYKFKLNSGTVENDVRTVYLTHYQYGNIKICSTIIYKDESFIKAEYIEIHYKDKYSCLKKYLLYGYY